MATQTLPLLKDCQIRRMRPVDVPEIMAIESISFGRHHWSEDSFLSEMNGQLGRYYVLINAENVLLGYCGFWVVFDEGHITTVAVHPDWRGHALGELLLLHIVDRCQNQSIRWLTLEVRSSNQAAQNLYYKYGFESVGVRPKYYQDTREDALIMTTPDLLSESYRNLHREQRAGFQKKFLEWPQGFGVS